jgi:hypothetical protein
MAHKVACGSKQTWANAPHMSAYDPKRTWKLFSRHISWFICAQCNLPPNDINMAAKVIKLV